LHIELECRTQIPIPNIRGRKPRASIHKWDQAMTRRKIVPENRRNPSEIGMGGIELFPAKNLTTNLQITAIPMATPDHIRQNQAVLRCAYPPIVSVLAPKYLHPKTRAARNAKTLAASDKSFAHPVRPDRHGRRTYFSPKVGLTHRQLSAEKADDTKQKN